MEEGVNARVDSCGGVCGFIIRHIIRLCCNVYRVCVLNVVVVCKCSSYVDFVPFISKLKFVYHVYSLYAKYLEYISSIYIK